MEATRPGANGHKRDRAVRRKWYQVLGPGLVTGAADDDPSGIATYSQVGAQFGYGMLWVSLFAYPLMTAIQEISGRIGRTTGRGIAANVRRFYTPWLLYPLLFVTVVANTINLAADLGAMGEGLKLLIPKLPEIGCVVGFTTVTLLSIIFVPYSQYAKWLKWLTMALFAYVATVFVVHVPWKTAIFHTIVPHIQMTRDFAVGLTAVLGTTISPYLFFWQASEEVEEERDAPTQMPLLRAPRQAISELRRIRADTLIGMGFSELIAFFIILTAAVTLHRHGVTDVNTASQAAEALRPIAGKYAFDLFVAGIVGTGLLAVPVLGASSAYAIGEALRWPVGLEHKPQRSKRFYGLLAATLVFGLALNLIHIDPIKALFWSAVLNGVVSVPIMIVMMIMASNPKIMGQFVIPRVLKIVGWIATVLMAIAAVVMFATMGKS